LIVYDVSHDVKDPQVNQDYVKDFAAPELYASSTLFQAAMVKFTNSSQGMSLVSLCVLCEYLMVYFIGIKGEMIT
jgi:hypothetical protein